MRRGARVLARVTCVCALLPGAAPAQETDPELAALSIGIAPFEAVAPPGLSVPELAPALAAQILALGAGRTLSPASLVQERVAEPSESRVRALAGAHGLDALVVGRVTRLGQRLSLDVRLRDGRSGAVAGTYVAELPVQDPAEPVLAHLATQLVTGALSLRQLSLTAQRAEPAAELQAPGSAGSGGGGAGRTLSLEKLDDGGPFSIRSDELEATEVGSQRTLVFRHNVEARQGDLSLRTALLEASYPEGSKQPSSLRARGGVRVRHGSREARCERADYVSAEQRIVCRGNAVLRDGEDELRGESIVFDLETQRVTVEGGTELALTSAAKRQDASGPLGDLSQDGPVRIRAAEMEATEDAAGGRRVRFAGSVEVSQEDLVLRAREIEALYPPGADEPERLIATGDVSVLQGGREGRCDRAVYLRVARRVECSGNASLQKGGDSVTGERISFDLEAEKLVVSGDTRLSLAPRERPEGITP